MTQSNDCSRNAPLRCKACYPRTKPRSGRNPPTNYLPTLSNFHEVILPRFKIQYCSHYYNLRLFLMDIIRLSRLTCANPSLRAILSRYHSLFHSFLRLDIPFTLLLQYFLDAVQHHQSLVFYSYRTSDLFSRSHYLLPRTPSLSIYISTVALQLLQRCYHRNAVSLTSRHSPELCGISYGVTGKRLVPWQLRARCDGRLFSVLRERLRFLQSTCSAGLAQAYLLSCSLSSKYLLARLIILLEICPR